MDAAKRRIRMQVRATPDAGDGTFIAIVSTYEIAYDIGWGWTEQILQGCFADSIAAHPTIPIFYQHNWDAGLIGAGQPSENGTELAVTGRLYLELNDPFISRTYQGMKDGALEEWSIGFWPEQITWDSDDPRCDMIAKGDLAEASVCVRGANPETGTVDLAARGKTAWIEGGTQVREREVARLRKMFAVPDLSKRHSPGITGRADNDPNDDQAGHTHEHTHDDGATHTHEHTHSAGNYDHGQNSADPDNEVAHAHGHPDQDPGGDPVDEDPGADEATRSRINRALDSKHWRDYAASAIKEIK